MPSEPDQPQEGRHISRSSKAGLSAGDRGADMAKPADDTERSSQSAGDEATADAVAGAANGFADDPDLGAEAVRGLVLAIDGPAGSGKSSVAKAVAEAMGLPHIDTGAVYRAAALACLRARVDLGDAAACAATVNQARIESIDGRTYLDGQDVEDEIRGDAVTSAVSLVAAHAPVRELLVHAQRATIGTNGAVMEGRDIGTVVLPDADLKVFLTAEPTERARRRANQLGRKDVEVLAAQMVERDARDGGRAVAPLQAADDAWVLDTTELELADTVAAVIERVHEVAAGVDHAMLEAQLQADPLAARKALPRVAIVGRPNVGKSTLLNRILGQRVAIVEEKPGVTRDRTEHIADWLGRQFVMVDTGGWEHGAEGMGARIVEQAERAIADADLVLFVVDATVGALEDDERYAKLLRRAKMPALLVANKVDGERQEPAVHELYTLGLGTPYAVSARHGRGVGDMLDALLDGIGRAPDVSDAPYAKANAVPRVAIVGKPNVGKSSLFNRLLGEDRSIVDATAHTTRDSIDTMVEVEGQPWVFVDTAGMRRKYRSGEDTELYSVDRTRDAIANADLVLFVIDASEPIGEQDQRLAGLLRDAGRGVVLVCNKWDLVDEVRRGDFERELDRQLAFAAYAPRVNISARTGRGARRLMPQLATVWAYYRRRIPTRELNTLVNDAVARHPLPRRGTRQLKIRYATQAEVAPPRFVLFANGKLPDGYRRYIERRLREKYEFTGVPLAIDDRPRPRRDRR